MKNRLTRGHIIEEKFEVAHFIEQTSFCQIYSLKGKTDKKLYTLNLYNAAKIARDDLDKNGKLLEIGFLKMRIKGLPSFVSEGEFKEAGAHYHYYITEFISGESVLDRIKREGPFDEFKATKIISDILDIITTLHSFDDPILLNGLSLNNLMIDMSGPSEKIVIRNIINFRYFSSDFKFKYIDGVNPNFLANEVFNNIFTLKSDFYNIGAIYYSLMNTSTPPWYTELNSDYTSEKSIDKILDSRTNRLSFSFEADEHVQKVIENALEENVDNRFESALDFKKALLREKVYKQKSKAPKKKIKTRSGNGFDDIAGMNELKTILKDEVIDVLNDKEKYERYGVTIPNGMLLYGPPGCGKTFISEKFAEEVGFNFIKINPSDLGSIYIHGAQEKIGKLFQDAESNAPAIIFFDEVDALMPKRGDGMNQSVSGEVNEFLAQMTNCAQRGIFIIAATNQPTLIDEAILRTGRIDRLIYVDAPDHEARKAMFELYLKKRPTEIDIDYSELADLTENIVSSDIKEIIDRASKLAAKNDTRISQQEIKQVIKLFRPSISVDVLLRYQEIRSKLEGNNKVEYKICKNKNCKKRYIAEHNHHHGYCSDECNDNDNYRPIGF